MNALAASQDKNPTLEKNFPAETSVKLDLFSALGNAKRQLDIFETIPQLEVHTAIQSRQRIRPTPTFGPRRNSFVGSSPSSHNTVQEEPLPCTDFQRKEPFSFTE
uniref:Macoilin n=1 Tax=Glossina pallidipes TaxID=7398 RepID=A0A1A9ZP23_GLOPL